MWPTPRLKGALSSPPSVTHGRPWTPPDDDMDYFTDPFATDSIASDDDLADSWPDHSLISPPSALRPKPVERATEPTYAVQAHTSSDASPHERNGRLEYMPDVELHTSTASVKPVSAGDAPAHAHIHNTHTRNARPHLDVTRFPTAPALYSPMEEHHSYHARAQTASPDPSVDLHTAIQHLKTPDLSTSLRPSIYRLKTPDPAVDPCTTLQSLKTPDPDTKSYNGIPQYPYTPDSARTNRTYGHPLPAPLSPLPPMPWENERKESSPMQSALSSCIAHLENLIDTRQPNDEQMEYLVTKFEEMASFLSAPEAQSRQSDDHLFSEMDAPSGLGITNANGQNEENSKDTEQMRMGASYILEVEKYIEGVKKNTLDLKMRFDETKQLNSIQLEIIADLRNQLRESDSQMQAIRLAEPKKDGVEQVREKRMAKPNLGKRMGFWAAVGQALDVVGEMLWEV